MTRPPDEGGGGGGDLQIRHRLSTVQGLRAPTKPLHSELPPWHGLCWPATWGSPSAWQALQPATPSRLMRHMTPSPSSPCRHRPALCHPQAISSWAKQVLVDAVAIQQIVLNMLHLEEDMRMSNHTINQMRWLTRRNNNWLCSSGATGHARESFSVGRGGNGRSSMV